MLSTSATTGAGCGIRAVPAAQEIGDQSGGRGEQRDRSGSCSWLTAADGQFAFGKVGDQGQVLAMPFDDVVGAEGRVGPGAAGMLPQTRSTSLASSCAQKSRVRTWTMFSSISRRVNSAVTRWPDLGQEVDGELGGGDGDGRAEASAPFGDPGQPAGEHVGRDIGDGLAGRREQVVLPPALLDDQRFSADLLEGMVEGVDLLADR